MSSKRCTTIAMAVFSMNFVLLGCSKSSEHLGAETEALEAGTQVAIAQRVSTPSAIVFAAGKLLVGMTDSTNHLPAWSFSPNLGATWNARCDVTNPSNCNTGSVPGLPGQVGWVFNPKGAMATDGHQNVVYAVLADTDGNQSTAEQVGLLISTNPAGPTFLTSVLVNDNTGGDCNATTEDSPDATFDMTTTPPTLWVAWRHKSGSSYGICVRRGQFVSRVFHWLDFPQSVGGLDRENDFDPNMGQGGLRIQAGDGIVTIGYSNNDEIVSCPSTSMMSIAWGTVSFAPQSQGWSNTSKVFHTDHFLSCPFGTIQNGIRAFDFVRAQDGTYYFAVTDFANSASQIHLFMSGGSGAPVSGGSTFVWRELCPAFQATPDGGAIDGGPASMWTPPGVLCPQPLASASAIMFPTLATDVWDRVALLYVTLNSSFSMHPTFWGNVAPRVSPSTWEEAEPFASAFAASGTSLLEHLTMIPELAPRGVACDTNANLPFFPIWLSADGSVTTLNAKPITL